MATFTCDQCEVTAETPQEAIAHATAALGHEVSGPGPIEGTTLTISYGQPDCHTCEDSSCPDCDPDW